MRTLIFSSQNYDRDSFLAARLPGELDLHFQPARLTLDTVALADRCPVVCAFINDDLSAPVLEQLAAGGTQLIALRSAGYNHVDLAAAKARLNGAGIPFFEAVVRPGWAQLFLKDPNGVRIELGGAI